MEIQPSLLYKNVRLVYYSVSNTQNAVLAARLSRRDQSAVSIQSKFPYVTGKFKYCTSREWSTRQAMKIEELFVPLDEITHYKGTNTI